MNIQEICVKYQISDSFLNSKDDGFTIGINSLNDIIKEIHAKKGDPSIGIKLEKLRDFLIDVKSSSY